MPENQDALWPSLGSPCGRDHNTKREICWETSKRGVGHSHAIRAMRPIVMLAGHPKGNRSLSSIGMFWRQSGMTA